MVMMTMVQKMNRVRIIEKPCGARFQPDSARDNREAFRGKAGTKFAKTQSEFSRLSRLGDVWSPTFCKSPIELLQKRPDAVLAFSHAHLIGETIRFLLNGGVVAFADGMLPLLCSVNSFCKSSGVLYRRGALQTHALSDESSILEEYELYLKLCADGEFAFDSRNFECVAAA